MNMNGYDFSKYLRFVDKTLDEIVKFIEWRFVYHTDLLNLVFNYIQEFKNANEKEGIYLLCLI